MEIFVKSEHFHVSFLYVHNFHVVLSGPLRFSVISKGLKTIQAVFRKPYNLTKNRTNVLNSVAVVWF